MKNIYVFVFLYYYVFKVVCVSIIPVEVIENGVTENQGQMNGIIYKTVNKYYCSTDHMSGINLILYGTNAWTFPEQDVNLTLRYPTTNPDTIPEEKFMVTGFQVVLYIDGKASQGFITGGGILQDSITLTFTSRGISKLRYQFWVYGIRTDYEPSAELNSIIFEMCT